MSCWAAAVVCMPAYQFDMPTRDVLLCSSSSAVQHPTALTIYESAMSPALYV